MIRGLAILLGVVAVVALVTLRDIDAGPAAYLGVVAPAVVAAYLWLDAERERRG